MSGEIKKIRWIYNSICPVLFKFCQGQTPLQYNAAEPLSRLNRNHFGILVGIMPTIGYKINSKKQMDQYRFE
jgi:hypothetical protein